MAAKPIKLAITADARDAISEFKKIANSSEDMARDIDRDSAKIESSLNAVGDSAGEMASTSAQVAGGIGDLGGAMAATGVISEGTAAQMDTMSQVIMGVTGVSDLAEAAFTKLKGSVIAQKAATIAKMAVDKAAAAATKAWAAVQWVLNAAMTANPIGLIVVGIIALIAIIVLLVGHWDKVVAVTKKVWGRIKEFAGFLKDSFIALIKRVGEFAKDMGSKVWAGITSIGSKIKGIGAWVWGLFKPGMETIWDKVKKIGGTLGGRLWSGIKDIGKSLRTIGTWVWNNFYPGPLLKLGDRVLNKARDIGGKIWTGIKGVGKSLQGIGSWAWDKVSGGLSRLVTNFRNKGKDLASALVNGLESKWKDIRSLTKAPLNFIITKAINPFIGKINGWIPGKGPIDTVNTFSGGGWTGPGSKYQPAGIVHADEFVIQKKSRSAIERVAPGFLDFLNNFGYAGGGRVWPLKGGVTSTYAGHSGVDLNAPNDYGAPVFAVTGGTAYPYSSSWAGAHSVRLLGGGTSQIYAHLMGRGKLGRVSAGDVIGYVGSEGNSTGPHLHFQIDPSGYGPAMGFLRGASAPSGGGGFSFKNWVVDKATKLIDPLLKKINGAGVISTKGIRAVGEDAMGKFLDKIPGLAKGGVVQSRSLIWAGEDGPEAVIPMKRLGSRGGNNYYEITVDVPVNGNPVETGKQIVKAIQAYETAGGRRAR